MLSQHCLKQSHTKTVNWSEKEQATHITVVGWLNFFFLGAGGSGMPYFSLLSAARSLYFIYSSEEKHFCSCTYRQQFYKSSNNAWLYFCFFSFQLFQLCFAHFGSSENLQVFLEKNTPVDLTSFLKFKNMCSSGPTML